MIFNSSVYQTSIFYNTSDSCTIMLLKCSLIRSAQLFQCSLWSELGPLIPSDPEFLSPFHYVRQNSTAEEDHVLAAWGIFNSDFEFLRQSA